MSTDKRWMMDDNGSYYFLFCLKSLRFEMVNDLEKENMSFDCFSLMLTYSLGKFYVIS